MTKFVIELHYDDGSRQMLGPFDNAAAAAWRGEMLLALKDWISPPPAEGEGRLLKYRVAPINCP